MKEIVCALVAPAAAVIAALLGATGAAPVTLCFAIAAGAACVAAAPALLAKKDPHARVDRPEMPPVIKEPPALAPEAEPPAAYSEAFSLIRDGALMQRVSGKDAEHANAALAAAQSALDEAQALAELLASGDLSVWESDAHGGQYAALLAGIGRVAGGLRTMISAIDESACEVDREAGVLQLDAEALTDGMNAQTAALAEVRAAGDGLLESLKTVRRSADAGETAAARAAGAADEGRKEAEEAQHAIRAVVARSREIGKLLTATKTIAQQTKLLGVNAAVEAARAGEAGRGFAVVAAEIQALATRTAEASSQIETQLAENDAAVESCAAVVTRGADALNRIAEDVASVSEASGDIRAACGQQEDAVSQSLHGIAMAERAAQNAAEVARRNGDAVESLNTAATRMRDRLDGILLSDDSMADEIMTRAAEASRLFEEGVRGGRISIEDLFSDSYTPIEGTNPPQYTTPYVAFTDQVLPPLLESVFEIGGGVTFCAAVNRDGFLPTHNRKFSQPQGNDAAKNGAASRNRRFFDDRVGLTAGRSTAPHVIQAYRRDMGGGDFITMKDISAPIMVMGRHWGGLRIGYLPRSTELGGASGKTAA